MSHAGSPQCLMGECFSGGGIKVSKSKKATSTDVKKKKVKVVKKGDGKKVKK